MQKCITVHQSQIQLTNQNNNVQQCINYVQLLNVHRRFQIGEDAALAGNTSRLHEYGNGPNQTITTLMGGFQSCELSLDSS